MSRGTEESRQDDTASVSSPTTGSRRHRRLVWSLCTIGLVLALTGLWFQELRPQHDAQRVEQEATALSSKVRPGMPCDEALLALRVHGDRVELVELGVDAKAEDKFVIHVLVRRRVHPFFDVVRHDGKRVSVFFDKDKIVSRVVFREMFTGP